MESKVLNHRYRLLEQVGSGGLAAVYRGHDLLLDRAVAIKILRDPYAGDPAFRRRFLEEARAAGRLDHPNIVHIYDVGLEESHPYIVMELVEGTDLRHLIAERAPFDLRDALQIARQICAGVGEAHKAGIVHCDLKPQNILITADGTVKVADFGIARAFQAREDEEERPKAIWGSPHYISPEQAAGRPPLPASDVYSIGIILYEMLTGAPPFHEEDTRVLLLKHLRETPTPMQQRNPRVPDKLDEIVRTMLAKEPTMRYRNAVQAGMILEGYLRELEGETRPVEEVVAAPPAPPMGEDGEAAEGEEEAAPEEDRFLWMLFVLAIILVLGLIPLWWRVYRVYSENTPPPATFVTPTPTLDPQAEVSVPNLVGLSAADAQRVAESHNLTFRIGGSRMVTDVLPGTVVEQSPNAGAIVTVHTAVEAILAAGRPYTLPDLVGYQVDVVLPHLETEGLLVTVDEEWSTEPKGRIIAQEPPPETVVHAGQTITLTVSGGTDVALPMHVNFADMIMLDEALVPQRPFHPGDSIPVTLRWHALQPVPTDYTVFVHLIKPDMVTLINTADSGPVNGTMPTSRWQVGEIVVDPHLVTIPEGTPPGTYQIRIGLYNTEGRLTVVDSGETTVSDNSVFISNVEITP